MKAKIKAWAVVTCRGDIEGLYHFRRNADRDCAYWNGGAGPKRRVVPLTGTFTTPKRKRALAAVRGKK